jgi:hypothetical protein
VIDYYLDRADPEAIRFHGLDVAVVGTDQNGFLIYDYQMMINIFRTEGMTEEEAIEWIDYNVLPVMGGQGFTILFNKYEPVQDNVH